MKYIINDDVVLSRPLAGPLAAHIAAFTKWARDEGYARQSRYRRVLLAAGFSRWLGQQAVRVPRVSSEHPKRYLRCRARRVQVHKGDAAALRQFLGFLRRHGVIPSEKVSRRRLTPIEQEARAFEHYLRDERALAHATALTTCRSSVASSRIGSAVDRSRSRACVPATSCALSSAKRRVCI